jgi:hypothetical protein
MRPIWGSGTLNTQLRQRSQFAAVAPAERNRTAADRIRVVDGLHHVGGITGTAERHDDVAGLGEVLQRFHKNAVITQSFENAVMVDKESANASMRKRFSCR